MKREERLADFKTDILLHIPKFLEELNGKEDDINFNAFKQYQPPKKSLQRPSYGNENKYCRMCYLSKRKREIFTSHEFGDLSCPSLSIKDRKSFLSSAKLSVLKEDSDCEGIDEEELAEMYGYSGLSQKDGEEDHTQVISTINQHTTHEYMNRNKSWSCSHIQPLPSQILTVYLDEKNIMPFHIELDSGATVSYVREDIAHKYKFDILPNNQVSKLGDGCTKLMAIGEIKIPFFRNSFRGIFHAIVCRNLTSAAIGGTNFM